MKSDSLLLKDGKPFFILILLFGDSLRNRDRREDRPAGKNIAERFIHVVTIMRVMVGIDFLDRDLQNKLRAQGLLTEISKAFDNSAVLGHSSHWSVKCEPHSFPI